MPIPVKSIRLEGKETRYLNTASTLSGELLYDKQRETLVLSASDTINHELLRADLNNLDGDLLVQKIEDAGFSGGASITVSESAPTGVESGAVWLNLTTGQLFVYVDDGDSQQWIQPTVASTGGGGGLAELVLDPSPQLGANLDSQNYRITNIGEPVDASDAVTKSYVDGKTWLTELELATGATVNEFSTDDTMSGNSNFAVPVESAVRGYVLSQIGGLTTPNLFSQIDGDVGSVSASTPTTILDIAGGAGIQTTVSGATLTIDYNGAIGFTQINVGGANLLSANSGTINLVAGANITLTPNAATNTIQIDGGAADGGTGGVASGVAGQLGYYAATGSTISGTGNALVWDSQTETLSTTNLTVTGHFEGAVTFTDDIVMEGNLQVDGDTTLGDVNLNSVTNTNIGTPTLTSGNNINLVANAGQGSVNVSGNLSISGTFSGDASGLTNLPTTTTAFLDLTDGPTNYSGASGQVVAVNQNENGVEFITIPEQNLFESVSADTGATTANASTDTLFILGGTDIETSITADTLTINYTGTASGEANQNAFSNFVVNGQNTVSADSATDSVTFVAGTGMTITTDSANDTITFASSGGGGGIALTDLSVVTGTPQGNGALSYDDTTGEFTFDPASVPTDINQLADSGNLLKTDSDIQNLFSVQVNSASGGGNLQYSSATGIFTYTPPELGGGGSSVTTYPAITQLVVTANGFSAYNFNNQYSGDNPTLYAISGTTIAFDLSNAGGHPFQIQTTGGTAYNTGLIHIASDGTETTGANANGKDSGTLYWQIPIATTGNYEYQCTSHGAMNGTINIKDFATL